MTSADVQRFAKLALDCIDREYPYHLSHLCVEPGAVESPRSLTPVFYGCFDWHSAVHGHWVVARSMHLLAGSDFSNTCREALNRSLTAEGLEVEGSYVADRPGFERPYGLAWLLTLAAELHLQEGVDVRRWREAIRPLEQTAAKHLQSWLLKLTHPNRTGTHNQTAFAMVLAMDWADAVEDAAMQSMLRQRSLDLFGSDHGYALHLEPSGEDFLSPSLAGAWVMRRVLEPGDFSAWIDRAMPELGCSFNLRPVAPSDRSDGRLCHLDGLNLSRAWMLRDIVGALPEHDTRLESLSVSADVHELAGLEGVSSEYYAGAHWLGTFAVYLRHRR